MLLLLLSLLFYRYYSLHVKSVLISQIIHLQLIFVNELRCVRLHNKCNVMIQNYLWISTLNSEVFFNVFIVFKSPSHDLYMYMYIWLEVFTTCCLGLKFKVTTHFSAASCSCECICFFWWLGFLHFSLSPAIRNTPCNKVIWIIWYELLWRIFVFNCRFFF